MNELRNTFKELYETIPDWYIHPLKNAINVAEESNEVHIVEPLLTLIRQLSVGVTHVAINKYMTDPITRHSTTRKFFFPHTLYGNLYPEDREIYKPSFDNSSLEVLQLKPSPAIPFSLTAPRIDSFFESGVQEAIFEMSKVIDSKKAQAPSSIPRD